MKKNTIKMLIPRYNSGSTPSVVEGLTKAEIRGKMLPILRKQEEEKRTEKSKKIGAKLFRLEVVKKAKTIMFYHAFDGEVKTDALIKRALKKRKKVLVPVCYVHNRRISPCELGLRAKFKVGPYGIFEPHVKRHMPLDKIDVVIVPGVAFDKKGNRLGRGKGYFDRFLDKLSARTKTIGLAFDFQILPSIPQTASDLPVDKVIFA